MIAGATSPVRAIIAASSPSVAGRWSVDVLPYLIVMLLVSAGLNGLAIWKVRIWNPSRDVRPGQADDASGNEAAESGGADEAKRHGHVDDRTRTTSQKKSRRVWDNPVLWRESCTWAHGKKILFIRVAYWLLAGFVLFALVRLVGSSEFAAPVSDSAVSIPAVARPLAPFMLVSLVMINALSVTSITNERDGRALDLLLVTDLSPKEFFFGKLGGIFLITLDVVLLPMLMCAYIWGSGGVSLENLVYLIVGLIVLNIFVAVLGIHCGMIYGNSRQAIGVSLGTVFFLFLGIVTSMVMMVSFTGNVEAQLTPFLACIVGGGVGLYVALGMRNQSAAIALASGILPLAMFFSITSLLLGRYLSVILVIAFTYGFATTAMVMPALGEFNISMGRAKTAENE